MRKEDRPRDGREPLRKPCVRCLVRDLPEGAALSAVLRERVALLSPEERVAEEIREERLAACRVCPHLNRGTCAMCGCYVEVRSARKGLGCPDVPPRWPGSAREAGRPGENLPNYNKNITKS